MTVPALGYDRTRSQHFCVGCGNGRETPHSWEECLSAVRDDLASSRARITALESQNARLRAALETLVELPVTGPACQLHERLTANCTGCRMQEAYQLRCADVENQARAAIKEFP